VKQQNPRPAVPTVREAEIARNTSDVEVYEQLLGESVGGESLPDVTLPNVTLPDVHLLEVDPDGLVGEE